MFPTWQNVVWVLCLSVGGGIIFVLTSRLILDTRISSSIDSPSSFFTLDDITSTIARTNINLIFTWPLVLLFVALSTTSETLVQNALDLVGAQLVDAAGSTVGPYIKALIDNLQGPLAPLFVLIVTLVLFAPYIRKILETFAALVVQVSGYRGAVDAAALDFAGSMLERHRFHDIQRAIGQKLQKSLPIREELAAANKQNILAYQLLYLKRSEAGNESIHQFLTGFPETILDPGAIVPCRLPGDTAPVDAGPAEQPPAIQTERQSSLETIASVDARREPVAVGLIAVAFLAYCVLCLLYVALVPQLSALIAPVWPVGNLGPLEWPLPEYRTTLAYSIAQRTVSFVFALAAGYYIFSTRRRLKGGEPVSRTFLYTAAVQFVLALIANLVFLIIMFASTQGFSVASISQTIANLIIVCDLVVYSLVPCVALGFSVLCARSNYPKLLTVVLIGLVSAVSFWLSQFLNETMGQHLFGYYWHQMLLGLYMTFAYFLAAMIVNDTTFLRLELNPNAAANPRPAPMA